jgi:hypothetical protein
MAEIRNFTMNFSCDVTLPPAKSVSAEVHLASGAGAWSAGRGVA